MPSDLTPEQFYAALLAHRARVETLESAVLAIAAACQLTQLENMELPKWIQTRYRERLNRLIASLGDMKQHDLATELKRIVDAAHLLDDPPPQD